MSKTCLYFKVSLKHKTEMLYKIKKLRPVKSFAPCLLNLLQGRLHGHGHGLYDNPVRNVIVEYWGITLELLEERCELDLNLQTYKKIQDLAFKYLGNVSKGDLYFEFNTKLRRILLKWAL